MLSETWREVAAAARKALEERGELRAWGSAA